MVKKLDPHTVITTFLHNRQVLERLAKCPSFQREATLINAVIAKGEDTQALLLILSDIKKVNSFMKSYVIQQEDMLRTLGTCAEKIDVTLRTTSFQPKSNNSSTNPQLARLLTDIIPKVMDILQKLPLTQATRCYVSAPVQSLNTAGVSASALEMERHSSDLAKALMALSVSELEHTSPSDGIRSNIEKAYVRTEETSYNLATCNIQSVSVSK